MNTRSASYELLDFRPTITRTLLHKGWVQVILHPLGETVVQQSDMPLTGVGEHADPYVRNGSILASIIT